MSQDQEKPPAGGKHRTGPAEKATGMETFTGRTAAPPPGDPDGKTHTFTILWDQARRRRTGRLSSYFQSFGPRWHRKDWADFHQARLKAESQGAPYRDFIDIALDLALDRGREPAPKDLISPEIVRRLKKRKEPADAAESSTAPGPPGSIGGNAPLAGRSEVEVIIGHMLNHNSKKPGNPRAAESVTGPGARHPGESGAGKVTQSLSGDAVEELEKLNHMANFDQLTRLANYRKFEEYLESEWLRQKREQAGLSLALVRIDDFDHYLLSYGQETADQCLKGVAWAVSAAARRPADLAARLGRQEFGLILPHTGPAGARHVADTLRFAVTGLGIAHLMEPDRQTLSISIALASALPGADSSARAFLKGSRNLFDKSGGKGPAGGTFVFQGAAQEGRAG